MKKNFVKILITASLAAILAGCSSNPGESGSTKGPNSTGNASSFNASKPISVVTRENGSGTRDAFIELTGVLTKDDQGNKKDNTTLEAITIDSTQGVVSNISGNEYAIGYISLGSLNNSVKAVKVGGVEATAENVKNNSYGISRPFNIATKETLSELGKDFVAFILSADGQKVIEDAGYIAVSDAAAYSGSKPSGSIMVAGSSSVSPAMEKLKEAYLAINPNASIAIQTTDSSAGMTAAKEGTCDIGMASRELKDSELETLQSTTIAMDGIAIIVNKANPCTNLTLDQIKTIYTSDSAAWKDFIEA